MQGPNAPWGCTLCSSAPYACPTHERHATRCAVVHRGSNPVTMACMMNGERSHETFVSCLLQALLRCCKGAVRYLDEAKTPGAARVAVRHNPGGLTLDR